MIAVCVNSYKMDAKSINHKYVFKKSGKKHSQKVSWLKPTSFQRKLHLLIENYKASHFVELPIILISS